MISLQKSRQMVGGLVVATIVALAGGCGGPYDAAVTGVITIDNAPVPRGTVKFLPQQAGPPGYGLIGSDGSYEVMTGRERGLQSGSYVVTVVANEESIPNPEPSLPPRPGKPITPPWYRIPAQSPLKFTVEPGSNEIDLDLSSQPPAGWNPGRRP